MGERSISVSSHTLLRKSGVSGHVLDRLLPPADYRVMTDEELIEGLSFPAYRRVLTAIFVPAPSGSAVEMVPINSLDLQAAQERDAAVSNAEPATALKS